MRSASPGPRDSGPRPRGAAATSSPLPIASTAALAAALVLTAAGGLSAQILDQPGAPPRVLRPGGAPARPGAGAEDPSAPVLTLGPVELRVLGQARWIAGSRAGLRVVVSDHDRGAPLPADVRITLARKEPGAPPRLLHAGRTDALGTLAASFAVPRLAPGAYTLAVAAATPAGQEVFTGEVEIEESADVLLTTDKPLYQPGQTIHLRALALRRPDRRPFKGEAITFEVEDARGNKVFKKAVETDRFGVASADFVLASEVNAGAYRIRAANPAASAERTVTVERYALPKFKVAVSTDRPYYRPGDRVAGAIRAGYFFGKPVGSGKVTVRVLTLSVGVEEIGRIEGTTDAEGGFEFEHVLPAALVGRPLHQGRASVEFEATVADAAGHQEKGRVSLPVTRDLLDVVVVPAARTLVPGVPNTVHVAVAYPDGTPARASVTIRGGSRAAPEASLATDEMGIASWTFVPDAESVRLEVAARDDRGNEGRAAKDLASDGPPGEGVILAASKALAAAGERLDLTVFSPARTGAVYLDVVRDRQTVLTRALDLRDGKAATSLVLTPDLAGTIQVHAYRILASEEIVRDTRTVHVRGADQLHVAVRPGRATYRPGEEAEVEFSVRTPDGRPAVSVLGIAGVDEGVLALSELHPGLERIYFTLERELMEPRYEIHGLTPSEIVGGDPIPVPLPGPAEGAAQAARRERARDRAARVLFAAAPPFAEFTLRGNTWRDRFERAKEAWLDAMGKDHAAIRSALDRHRRRFVNPLPPGDEVRLVGEGLLGASDLRDPWGRAYRIDRRRGDDWSFALLSAGPDGRWGTADDLEYGPEALRRRDGLVVEEGLGGVGLRMLAADRAAALPAAAPAEQARWKAEPAKESDRKAAGAGRDGDAAGPRVRSFFPETLYWNPSVLTDGSGRARVTIPLADSITTWRLTALAGDASGRLGSAEAPLRVFEDFFVDLDVPLWLTRGDEVAIPVAVHNYLPEPQTVALTLEPAGWFAALPGEGPAARGAGRAEVRLEAGEVAGVLFPIRAETFGRHALTVLARGSRLSDAVRREIEVLPEGREFRDTAADRLDGEAVKEVVIPPEAIAGASGLFVKLHPGAFSQVVEGLDALLRMPSGCFEQTSSTTYPNVLVLAYLRETKQAGAEIRMKAEGFINAGYQRLLTYEVDGGGFSWFGDAPAHQVLTAYGLLEFSDMAKVHEVDPALIERTQRWLAARQKEDGSWEPDRGGIAEGIINRQTDALRTTAYVAWALGESGYRGLEVARALDHLRGAAGRIDDPYALALVANAFAAQDGRSEAARAAARRLAGMKVDREGAASWETRGPTFTGAAAESADLETTGLAAYALLRTGVEPETARRALTHLIRNKDAYGTWRTTQATVWALRALLAAASGTAFETDATVRVACNGGASTEIRIAPEDSDVMRQVDCGAEVREGRNEVRLSLTGKGSVLYQVVSRYFVPFEKIPPPPRPVLSIDVDYDRTDLAKDEIVTGRVRVTNNTAAAAVNVVVDLAVPPGFEVLKEDLRALVGKEISRFEPAGRQVILYVDRVLPGRPLAFSFRMKATMMVRAAGGESAVYPYYNPEQRAAERPARFTTLRRGR